MEDQKTRIRRALFNLVSNVQAPDLEFEFIFPPVLRQEKIANSSRNKPRAQKTPDLSASISGCPGTGSCTSLPHPLPQASIISHHGAFHP